MAKQITLNKEKAREIAVAAIKNIMKPRVEHLHRQMKVIGAGLRKHYIPNEAEQNTAKEFQKLIGRDVFATRDHIVAKNGSAKEWDFWRWNLQEQAFCEIFEVSNSKELTSFPCESYLSVSTTPEILGFSLYEEFKKFKLENEALGAQLVDYYQLVAKIVNESDKLFAEICTLIGTARTLGKLETLSPELAEIAKSVLPETISKEIMPIQQVQKINSLLRSAA